MSKEYASARISKDSYDKVQKFCKKSGVSFVRVFDSFVEQTNLDFKNGKIAIKLKENND